MLIMHVNELQKAAHAYMSVHCWVKRKNVVSGKEEWLHEEKYSV
jgi:hypothetical protein